LDAVPEGFVSLARWLSREEPVESIESSERPTTDEPEIREPNAPDFAALFVEVRRFRAALADALEDARALLLRELAVDILGRELEIRAIDLRSIVARVCERYAIDAPVCVRVHPDDAAAIALRYAVVADTSLRRGDAVVEVSSGRIDARLGLRLDRVLRELA